MQVHLHQVHPVLIVTILDINRVAKDIENQILEVLIVTILDINAIQVSFYH